MRLITPFGNATNATNAKCQLNYFYQDVVSIQKSCIFRLRNKQRGNPLKQQKMYYLIEESPLGLTVIGNYMTEEDAQRKAIELWNSYCNYIITKVWE